MERPLIVGHSWGADVALEFAVANPKVPKGLCFVDGGMIQPSARYASLDQAREQMAPPIFSGVTLAAFTQRVQSRQASTPMSPGAEAAVLANFEVLPDDTIRAWLTICGSSCGSSMRCGATIRRNCTLTYRVRFC